MMQPSENGKNPNFRPNLEPQKIFSWILPLLVVRQCSKISSYAISGETNEPKKKNLSLGPILAYLVQISARSFFLRVSSLLVTRHCFKLSSYEI